LYLPLLDVLILVIRHSIDFTPHPDAIAKSKSKGLVRFFVPSVENWGPRSKAKHSSLTSKPVSLQHEDDHMDNDLESTDNKKV
jgi:hypothetical protein